MATHLICQSDVDSCALVYNNVAMDSDDKPLLRRTGFRATRTSNRGQCTGPNPRLLRLSDEEVWYKKS